MHYGIIEVGGARSFCLNSECEICPGLGIGECSQCDASLSTSSCREDQIAGKRHAEAQVSPGSDSVVATCSVRGHCEVETEWDSRLCNVLRLGLWRNRYG
jgi:hypothetical protein